MKLLFMDRQDVFNTWGQLRFGATPLERTAHQSANDPDATPDFEVRCCLPNADGSYTVYAGAGGRDNTPWHIVRFRTEDGITFHDRDVVLEVPVGSIPWAHVTTLDYSPDLELFLCLKNSRDGEVFATHAYTSRDGESWEASEQNPVYLEGDRWGSLWSPAVGRFITFNKGVQPYTGKPFREMANNGRRVVTIRTSPDGEHWEPDDPDLSRVDGRRDDAGMLEIAGKFVPIEYQLTPDDLDPPDLEFYAGQAFEYEGRYFLNMLNYAGCFVPPGTKPNSANGHGPNLDSEWWISRDGLSWQRPFRDSPAARGSSDWIQHNPMIFDGRLLFHIRGGVWSMPEDRLTYVAARSNGVFDTRQFAMPASGLRLNAQIPGEGFVDGDIQAYVMAELIDDRGRVITGYERERCLLVAPADACDIPLRWDGRSAAELAGSAVRVRFYFRAARLYAVTG